MNQHGFSPSRSARAMRGQSDKVVAIIVSRLDSLSENLAVQTMLPAFYEQGYDPIMMESQFSVQLVEEHLGMLQRRNIDGVVLFGFTGIKDEMLKPWQPSLVLLARDAHAFASVCYDDEGAIITLMQRCLTKVIATSASSASRTRTSPPASVAMRRIWPFAKSTTSPPWPPCRGWA